MSSILSIFGFVFLFITLARSASSSNLKWLLSRSNRGSLRGTEGIQVSQSAKREHRNIPQTYQASWSENQPDINNKHSDGSDRHLHWVRENPTAHPRTTDSYVNTVSSSSTVSGSTLIGQSCNLEMRWTIKSYWQEGVFIGSSGFDDLICE